LKEKYSQAVFAPVCTCYILKEDDFAKDGCIPPKSIDYSRYSQEFNRRIMQQND
jgi:hypothetical protein